MDKLIYNALEAIFASTLVQDSASFLKLLAQTLSTTFNDPKVSEYFTIFNAAAASLLIVFYFIDLSSNASRDMITLERLVLSFIKLMLGFTILLYLPEILDGLFALVQAVYDKVAELGFKEIEHSKVKFWGKDTFPEYDPSSENFKFFNDSIGVAFGSHLAAIVIVMISFVATYGARFASYLFAITNAVTLIGRAVFSPLAVVQCFDDGQKSSGIQYLKKFAADGLSLAVMLGILYAASLLQSTLTGTILNNIGYTNINQENALELLANGKLVFSVIAINVSSIGAIMKASQLSKEIVGSH